MTCGGSTVAGGSARRRLRPRRLLMLLAVAAFAATGVRAERAVHAAEPPQADFSLAQVFNCDPGGAPNSCNQIVRGIAPVVDLFFPGPGDYQVQDTGSYFELSFEHSAVLLPTLSTLTIMLNGVQIPNSTATANNAVRLDNTNRDKTVIRVDLPASILNRESNKVSLQFYQRFREPCDDPNNPALASTVYESTKLHYEYAAGFPFRARPSLDLKDYPYPFFKTGYTRAGQTYFVFPPNATRTELTAGATVAAGLGYLAGTQPVKLNAISSDQVTNDVRSGNDLIVIGTPQRNPLVGQVAKGTSITLAADNNGFVQAAAAAGGNATNVDASAGVVTVAPSPFDNDRAALAITGVNDDALLRAAIGLADQRAAKLLQGDSTAITEPRDLKAFVEAPLTGQPFDRSLADLGLPDTTVTGTGGHTITATFDGPPPPDQTDARLQLVISHSTLIDIKRSSVKVNLNGISVTSAALDNSNLNRGVVDLKIAGRDVRPGLNTLAVSFGTYARATDDLNECVTDGPERAWATLWSDSSIHINGGGASPQPPDLTLYPYPHLYTGSLAGSYLVVTPDPEVMQRALETATDIGRKSKGPGFLMGMIRSDDLSPDIKQRANLIVVGRPSQNPVIREINEKLPLQFQAANGQISDKIAQNRPEVLIATRDRAVLGIDEVIPSPYNADRTLTLVSGTTSEGLRLGRIAISRPVPSSNIIISSDERKPASVLSLSTKETRQAAKMTQKSAAAKNALPLLTTMFILAALALAAFWVYSASRRSQEEVR